MAVPEGTREIRHQADAEALSARESQRDVPAVVDLGLANARTLRERFDDLVSHGPGHGGHRRDDDEEQQIDAGQHPADVGIAVARSRAASAMLHNTGQALQTILPPLPSSGCGATFAAGSARVVTGRF